MPLNLWKSIRNNFQSGVLINKLVKWELWFCKVVVMHSLQPGECHSVLTTNQSFRGLKVM